MDKILFSERLREQRKKYGYDSILDFAKKYNETFPAQRKDRKDENKGDYAGILGTLKNYENPNKDCKPRLDIVDNLCKLLHCDVDYLLGNIECETHDIQFIHDKTGLSEDAIKRIISKNGSTPDQDFLNSFILSEAYTEIEYNMNWAKNDCHNISNYYKAFMEINSAIEKTMDKDEFSKLDIMRDRYASKLEHNGNQIQYLMYQCSLAFGNFMNSIRKSWSKEVSSILEDLEAPLPGLDSVKEYYRTKAPDTY